MNGRKIIKRLIDAGLVKVGEGSYGAAIKNSKGHIYKVGNIHSDSVPDAWFFYAQWIMTNKITNPHFPRIYSLQGDEHGYVATMESLSSKLEDEIYAYGIAFELETVFDCGLEDSIEELQDYGLKDVDSPDFAEAIEIARSGMEWAHSNISDEICWDIHAGNFMRRGENGPLVFLDPWFFQDC